MEEVKFYLMIYGEMMEIKETLFHFMETEQIMIIFYTLLTQILMWQKESLIDINTEQEILMVGVTFLITDTFLLLMYRQNLKHRWWQLSMTLQSQFNYLHQKIQEKMIFCWMKYGWIQEFKILFFHKLLNILGYQLNLHTHFQ